MAIFDKGDKGKSKSETFKRDASDTDDSKSEGQALGNHTEPPGDVASAQYAGDEKRPEAPGALEKIAAATEDKASKTTTNDPFPAHEGRAGERRARGGEQGARLQGQRSKRSTDDILRHARKALLAAGGSQALVADIDATLGDVDDGAPMPTPVIGEGALRALEEAAKVDPTSAARLAMERNNARAQGIELPTSSGDGGNPDKTGADVNAAQNQQATV